VRRDIDHRLHCALEIQHGDVLHVDLDLREDEITIDHV
jgi:hypothetical protein